MPEPGSPVPSAPETLGYERIRYERDVERRVATVTIHRPEVLNALDLPTLLVQRCDLLGWTAEVVRGQHQGSGVGALHLDAPQRTTV